MHQTIHAMFFSPTGTTKKVVTKIAETLSAERSGRPIQSIDFTLPQGRANPVSFSADDIVVFGTPVYAGRVPNILLNYLNTVNGNGATAVAVVVYGNRNYDEAAVELQDILTADGFRVIAAGAFIGEHAFSRVLAHHRPDEHDLAVAAGFAEQIGRKIAAIDDSPVTVTGIRPYTTYFIPKNAQGIPVDIRKVTPKTNSSCKNCKLCARVCPMGSIDFEDTAKLNGICIKCGACIKLCPEGAKYYDNENYLWHKQDLETRFSARREPELFV